jgi:hypothetical protein
MKLKFKHIALAAALVATGAAQAAIDTGSTSGNGELLLNLKWKDTNTTDGNQSASAAFDLGITMDYAMANFNTAGFTLSWDLNNYGSAFSTFLSTTNLVLANAEMNVFALDGVGTNPGDIRLVSTTSGISTTGSLGALTSSAIPTNGTLSAIPGNVTVLNFFSALNNSNSHNSVANGASYADAASGSAYFDNGSGMDKFGNQQMFDSTGKFDGSYAAGTSVLAGQAKALPFYMVTTSSNDPFGKATMTAFGADLDGDGLVEFDNNGSIAGGMSEYGLWTLQGSTLTYSVAAVPEAETYAMMLAGLGLMGTIIRRRRKSA